MNYLTIRIPVPNIRLFPGWVRRHKILSAGIAGGAVVAALIVRAAFTQPQPEYVLETARQGDLRQTVEAVGTVTSERDLQLQFPVSGIVQDVLVKQGDSVRMGQVLARLRAGDLGASVASAAARVASAEAQLKAMEEGARPEDIAITQADVLNKRAALDAAKASAQSAQAALDASTLKLSALRQEADVGLAGQIAVAGSTMSVQFSTADSSLAVLDTLWRDNDILDAAIKGGGIEYDLIKQQRTTVVSALQQGRLLPSSGGYDRVLSSLEQSRLPIGQAYDLLARAATFVVGLPETSTFTNADRQSAKDDLLTEKSALQSALSNIDAAIKALRDASAGYETKIAAEEASFTAAQGTKDRAEADMRTYEAAVATAEAQLQLKRVGSRPTDIAASRANLNQAKADLARASAEYAKTVLTAPIAGTITKVAVKPGEILPSGAAVTLLGDAPYRVEMYVSEIDVPKIQRTQSGSIELDAFRGTHMKLTANEIDNAPTDRDGVSKYRVKLDFVHPHPELKIGMTGDAEIVTGLRPSVVIIPSRAVLERSDGSLYVRVRTDDGSVEERVVTTGMEGEGGAIEVSGVSGGETVIVLEKN